MRRDRKTTNEEGREDLYRQVRLQKIRSIPYLPGLLLRKCPSVDMYMRRLLNLVTNLNSLYPREGDDLLYGPALLRIRV